MNLSAGIPKPATLTYSGTENIELAAENRLWIRTLAPAVDHLDQTVPVGKKWLVTLIIQIDEVDA